MKTLPSQWAHWLEGPHFVFTADQDWAPEWAIEALLAELRHFGVPAHVFRTNPSPALDRAAALGETSQGWHPNFLAGSTQGRTTSEVIAYCQRHFPLSRTSRSHCYAEDSFSSQALREAGIVADSQPATLFQGYLMPIVQWTGIMRFPVYFEDDVFFDMQAPGLNLESILETLFTPGLKILNFHPTFVAANTPDRNFHESLKSRIFSSDTGTGLVQEGRGTGDVLRELIGRIQLQGHVFQRFDTLVDRALADLTSARNIIPFKLLRNPVIDEIKS